MDTIALFAPVPETTDAIGALIAPFLISGDVVALEGALGAGKSALARAMIRARLRQPDIEVPSPSFALVQPYGAIIHADLYRLGDESEIVELGLFDDDDAIVLVEWPERAPEIFEREGLTIALSIPDDGVGRRIEISKRGERDLAELASALAGFRTDR